RRRRVRHPIEKIGTQGQDDAQRGADVVGGAGQAGQEGGAFLGGRQRVDLFELIDEEDDLFAAVAGACAQLGAQKSRLGGELLTQRVAFDQKRPRLTAAGRIGEV